MAEPTSPEQPKPTLRERYSPVRHIVKPLMQRLKGNPDRQAIQKGAFLGAEIAHKETEDAERRTRIDAKTGLPNSLAFREFAEREHDKVRRNPGINKLLLAISDIDSFGRYNSTYDELEGDKALQVVAESIQRTIRTTDLEGRWGGEEFAIAMPYQVDSAGSLLPLNANHPLERARVNVGKDTQETLPEQLTVSIGATEFDPDETFEECFKRASAAELAAKLFGKNRTFVARKTDIPGELIFEDVANNKLYKGTMGEKSLAKIVDISANRNFRVVSQDNGKPALEEDLAA